MPPATTGAGPFIEPPFARKPLTVMKSRFASNVQTISPVFVEYARSAPSFDGEKTMPGMTVTAENCALLQPRFDLPQTGGGAGVVQAPFPLASATACSPPGVSL